MRLRGALAGLIVVALAAPGVAGAATPRLKVFASCERLSRYAKAHFEQAPPMIPIRREITPVAAPEDEHSSTNVQEDGVDEPDTVKTDGRRLLAVAGGTLHAIDVRSATPRRLGSLTLPATGNHELLLQGDRVLVLTALGGRVPAQQIREPLWRPRTLLSEVDVSRPTAMRVVRTLEIAGAYVSARQHGATARVVIASVPTDGAVRPKATLTRAHKQTTTTRRLVRCRAVRRPAAFSGLELVTALTIDLDKGLPAVDSDAVLARADTVYASKRSLFVATHRYEVDAFTTEIHRFDTTEPRRTGYGSTGEVRGSLLSQWALSEHDGHLRVASTDDRAGESLVTVLKERGKRLTEVGQVTGLGKGERIFGVRFLGDIGYVVTFRQTDPLYTVDLHDPEHPRVRGELKLRGYSAYLHPLGDGLLLGVGQDATEQGTRLGTQLSLFDVSDPRTPRRLDQHTLAPQSGSIVEWDHHAFLHHKGLAVLPVDGAAHGFRITGKGIEPAGNIAQPGPITRSLVAAGRLLTVSHEGITSSRLDTLGGSTWLPFQTP
jgi:uncharacterized secreted protein with C-terminal beta-propeller domain